jgi:hypothetical protein
VEDAQRQADRLHVLAAGGCVDGPRTRANIKDDGALEDGDEKVHSLAVPLHDTLIPVKDDCLLSAVHYGNVLHNSAAVPL